MPTPPPMDPFPRQQGETATRLILSASAASSPEHLRRSLRRLFERFGDMRLVPGLRPLERQRPADFALEQGGAFPAPPSPLAPSGPAPERLPWSPLNLSKPPAVVADIDTLGRTIERVRNRLGCPHCCSGFDESFQRELELFAQTSDREPGGSNP